MNAPVEMNMNIIHRAFREMGIDKKAETTRNHKRDFIKRFRDLTFENEEKAVEFIKTRLRDFDKWFSKYSGKHRKILRTILETEYEFRLLKEYDIAAFHALMNELHGCRMKDIRQKIEYYLQTLEII